MMTSARRTDLAGLSHAEVMVALKSLTAGAERGETYGLFMLLRKNPAAALHVATYAPATGDIPGTHGMSLGDAAREAGQRSVAAFIDFLRSGDVHVNYPARWEIMVYHEEPTRLMMMQLKPDKLLQMDKDKILRTIDIGANAWTSGTLTHPSTTEQAYIKARQLGTRIAIDFPEGLL